MTVNADKTPQSNIYYGVRIDGTEEMSFFH